RPFTATGTTSLQGVPASAGPFTEASFAQQQETDQGREVPIQINGAEKDKKEKDLPDQPSANPTASLGRRFGSLLVGSKEPKDRERGKRASILGMPMSISPRGSGDVASKEKPVEKEAQDELKQPQQKTTGRTSRPHTATSTMSSTTPPSA